jgi:DNA-binding HxlR family transcriptional regulator
MKNTCSEIPKVYEIKPSTEICPMKTVQDLIAGKWKIMILWYLSLKIRRFNELQRLLPYASRSILTQHLRELEKDGIVHREVYKEVPPKVEYSLTETGNSFITVLNAMGKWGESYLEYKQTLNREKSYNIE